ncbi:MAG: DHA2 family efflux MFS transporter permease subunit [Thermodesulfobacteriota bacterium]
MTYPQAPPKTNKWLVAVTVMLPVFIQIMDTSVVNVSLPHIQGSLSAGLDEVTWSLTFYLAANAVVIPVTGWLASVLGRKRYLFLSLALFTGSSMACGAAPSLEVLVLARVIQGLGGGGLQPLSQAILLETFPPAERGIAMAIFGMGIVIAPIMGPVVGGWITDNWSWREIFYINVPVGIVAMIMAMFFVKDPPYIRRSEVHIDRWGLLLLCVGLGCLLIVLDKGERENWFNSSYIVSLSLVSAIALIVFVWNELRVDHPVVDLKVLRDRGFATGNAIMFMGFFALFGTLVLLPLYLQKLMNYTALWAGLVLGPGGVASFIIMPLVGALLRKGVNPRDLLGFGLSVAAVSIWLMSRFNLEAGFWAIAEPRLLLGVGMGLFFVPLSTATFVNIRNEEMGNATAIFNVLRNLGQSFGVAVSTTILAQRAQLHQGFLVERITPFDPTFQTHYQRLLAWLQSSHPEMANMNTALGFMYREVLRQANMLAFNDVFWILACMTALLVPLTLLFKAPGRKRR